MTTADRPRRRRVPAGSEPCGVKSCGRPRANGSEYCAPHRLDQRIRRALAAGTEAAAAKRAARRRH